MRHRKSRPRRISALILSALTAIVAAACDGGDRLPVGPVYRAPPPPPPPPPTTLPQSENATPGTYLRVDPAVAGSEEAYVSRFEIDRNGTFRLKFSTAYPGFTGAYSRQGSWYYFLFDANKPDWSADVSFGGKCIEVRFSEIAQMDDFENGRYCR